MNKQIAFELGITEVTVKLHRGNVMRKMNVRSLPDLVRIGEALGYGKQA
jgi:FixJ family two-component response regulator